MTKRIMIVVVLFAVCLGSNVVRAAETFKVSGLRCESRVEPVGIDVSQPRFRWVMESTARRQSQSACQILVATTQDALQRETGDAWEIGKRVSRLKIRCRMRPNRTTPDKEGVTVFPITD